MRFHIEANIMSWRKSCWSSRRKFDIYFDEPLEQTPGQLHCLVGNCGEAIRDAWDVSHRLTSITIVVPCGDSLASSGHDQIQFTTSSSDESGEKICSDHNVCIKNYERYLEDNPRSENFSSFCVLCAIYRSSLGWLVALHRINRWNSD